jgi:hypothetical protein
MLNKNAPQNATYHLYTNNHTPAQGDTLANYTESTDPSYGAATLTGASWTIATAAGVTTATYAATNFNFANAATLYGYYVTTADGVNLLWAELFTGGPINLAAGGGTVQITPTISLA